MQETTSEKQTDGKPAGAAPKKPSVVEKYFAELHGDGKLTRIPVAHLYFAENIDHSGSWEHQFSNAACFRPCKNPETRPRYYVADFIPAWQMFEVSAVSGPDATPATELLPVAHVRRWKRY